jgi:hypothetical protein
MFGLGLDIESVLRVAVALCFCGHGWLAAFLVQPAWLGYTRAGGFPDSIGRRLIPLIGLLDIALGVSVIACVAQQKKSHLALLILP